MRGESHTPAVEAVMQISERLYSVICVNKPKKLNEEENIQSLLPPASIYDFTGINVHLASRTRGVDLGGGGSNIKITVP